MGRRLVIGIGNQTRGDDAVGRAVARLLAGTMPVGVEVLDLEGEATAILDRLGTAESAILIDASFSGAAPGSVRRFDVAAAPLPRSGFATSTHGFGLVEAIELARSLGQLPEQCIVFAIEGASYETGEAMTPAVEEAARRVAREVRDEMTAAK